MIIALDLGHQGKTAHPNDRGASWQGREEAATALPILLAADRALRDLGHTAILLPDGGSYPERIAWSSKMGAAVYVQIHCDAGLSGRKGDRSTAIHDYRSVRGAALALAVAEALGKVAPWPVAAAAGRPDTNGTPRDRDLTEAYNCISACYALRPVGLLLEAGFLDGLLGADWLPANGADLGVALAAGIDAWVRSLPGVG
jgi:hypothetical protein